ncbi:Hpt domain-containing protein [Rugamonas sp. CCM 8940]|uniref:Hpt domain-containing protein n=1 Tax=Rugamonas sp. CCM 8940 TaxID=2765359 RepID=UPI0018F3B30D|nr:Hpt domain-containing protein [Rugamonas sp. CCM 8940]MBJ7311178.1 Hpt domain-containing protein [Rugamonas sp. CCM 8940]
MAAPLDAPFHAQLQALADKYAAGLPLMLDKIAAALAACRADGATPSAEHLHVLHELLHGMAGTAGTFGFALLGQQCRLVEQQLRQVARAAPAWPAAAADLDKVLRWAATNPRASTYD